MGGSSRTGVILLAATLLGLAALAGQAFTGDCPSFRGAEGIPTARRSFAAKMGLSPSVVLVAHNPRRGSRTGALHKAVRDQNHAEARRLADAMLKSSNQGERVAASLAYGRVLLSLGQTDAARQYLAFMGKLNLEADAAQQMYAAWLAALEGNAAEAIKTLEQMLVDRADGAATAEAADVLAQLYLARGDRAAAKKAVDFGLGFLKTSAGRPYPGRARPAQHSGGVYLQSHWGSNVEFRAPLVQRSEEPRPN